GCSLTVHLLLGVWIAWLASPVQRLGLARTGKPPDPMQVFVVPPVGPTTLPGLNPIDAGQDGMIRRGEGSSELSLPGFTFDFGKVANRATLLFPFVTPGLSLDRFVITPRGQIVDGFHDPFAATPITRQHGRNKPPLAIGDAALQSLIDECWSRRDRWTACQRLIKLADTYDPDAG